MTWEEKLIKIYTDSRERIMNELRRKLVWGFSTDSERSLLDAVDRELARLNTSTVTWAQAAIQENFLEAAQLAFKTISPTAAMPAYSAFTGLHQRAISMLVHNSQSFFEITNNLIARQAKDRVREIGVAITTRKFGENLTWQQTRKALEADLAEHGFMTVPWRNGKGQMRLDSYSDLVARTTTAEATNTGTINQMQEMGQGLVKISSHNTTCKVCAPRQGRVYRITDFPAGDERNQFPHISKGMPRWPTYKTIHVSCRHRLLPYVWNQKTDSEKQAALQDANKPFDKDPRSEAEINRYNAAQKKLAERLRDRKQWEKIKTVLPKDAPTFSGFRAMKAADSERYQQLQADYRKALKFANLRNDAKAKRGYFDYGPVKTPDVPAFTPAKTIQEASAYARKLVKGDFSIDDSMKLEIVNGFNESLSKVYGQYRQPIGITGLERVKQANIGHEQAHFDPKTKKIALKNSSLTVLQKNAERDFASGFSPTNDKYGVFHHEIGHAVWYDLPAEARSEINAVYSRAKRSNYLEWMDMGGSRSGIGQQELFAKKLSKYAITDEKEFFSESMSAIMTGSQKPLADEVQSILLRYYKK